MSFPLHHNSKACSALVMMVVAILLVACGGGGGSSVDVTPAATNVGDQPDDDPAGQGSDPVDPDPVDPDPVNPDPVEANTGPIISGMPVLLVGEEESYEFAPSASDPDGDDLLYSVENLPQWASFDTATGSITGSPSLSDAGVFSEITVSVSDGDLSAVLPPFDIAVFDVTVLALAGAITDSPISNAAVTISVAGNNFTGQADLDGNYTVELRMPTDSFSTDDLVTLTGLGVGEQSGIELLSQVGAIGRLLDLAGEDNALGSAEEQRLIASHVSTARYLLAIDYNGGLVPANEGDLFAAEFAAPSEELVELASLIKLVVDEALLPVTPAETSLGLFLSDDPAVANREVIAQVLANAGLADASGEFTQELQINLDSVTEVILSDASFDSAFTPDDLQEIIVSHRPLLPGDIASWATVYKFNDDGSGTEYPYVSSAGFVEGEEFSVPTSAIQWAINNDGTLVVERTTTSFFGFVDTVEELEALGFSDEVIAFYNEFITSSVSVNLVTTSKHFKPTAQTPQSWNVLITETGYYEIDGSLLPRGWQGELPRPEAQVLRNQVLLRTEVALEHAEPVASAGDSVALRIIMSPLDDRVPGPHSGFGVDLFTLLDNGTTTDGLISGSAFNWVGRADGTLLLENSNVRYIYTPLLANSERQLVLVTIERPGIESQYTITDAVVRDENPEMFISDLPSLPIPEYWQAGINNTRSIAYSDNGMLRPEYIFGHNFRADGTNTRVFGGIEYPACLDDDSRYSPCFFLEIPQWNWFSFGSRVELQRTSTISHARQWEVLRYDAAAKSAVVIEWSTILFQVSSDSEWQWWFFPRINWFSPMDLRDYPVEYQQALDAGTLEY